jgi:molybdopterin converting factor small subunit
MITVRLPATLRTTAGELLQVDEPVRSIAELLDALDDRLPGLRNQLDDVLFNFAVNDELLLHRARERALHDGDVVEIVPTISGG